MSNNSNKHNKNQVVQTTNQITASVLILSVILSFTIGLIGGYLIGEKREKDRIGESVVNVVQGSNSGNNGQSSDGSGNQVVESVDYSKYVINKNKGITVENFYGDADMKPYAAALLGMSMPEFKWKDSSGVEHSNTEFGNKDYIIEIFSPSCGYCQQSASEVDKYREAHPDIPLVSLTNVTGQDISIFNAAGENAFIVEALSSEASVMMKNYVPWIPAFLYVSEGKISLVTFGGVGLSDIEGYADIAFN